MSDGRSSHRSIHVIHRAFGILGAVLIGGLMAGVGGCDSGNGGAGGGSGRALYPRVDTPLVAAPAGGRDSEGASPDPLTLVKGTGDSPEPVLLGIQTDLSPGTLWHSPANQVSLFADLARIGLGAPSFLAYSSPTGIASLRPGGVMTGDQMRENWLLAAFPGASGWTDWDSPWAVFFQNRPRHVVLETNTVTIGFDGPAGWWTLMPLYGTYLPPQQGREILKAQGLKEKGLLTWEWPLVVARDPLTRLRYWAGATRRFPVRTGGGVGVRGRKGAVVLTERFDWMEIPDAWSTRPVEIAPVSPVLGLVLTKGQTFPVKFSKAPFDFEMPTVYGPWFGVPDARETTMSFAVLEYINESERVTGAGRATSAITAPAAAALEALRDAGREVFQAEGGYRPEGGGDWASKAALTGYLWQARALEFLDETSRSNAVVDLRRGLRDHVLVPERWAELAPGVNGVEPKAPEREPRDVDDPEWASSLVQALWAVAHGTGDRALVRERWPLVRQAWERHRTVTWAGFGRRGIATLGDGAAPAIAWTRLAWLAGDQEAYRAGCGDVARELVLLHARLRGGAWFREQQPWRPGPAMPETVAPWRLPVGTLGWEVAGPGWNSEGIENWPGNRWRRFVDWDVARFCRHQLAAEVEREIGWLEQARSGGVDKGEFREVLAALREMGFGLGKKDARTVLDATIAPGAPSSARFARALAILRAEGWVRTELLIPPVDLEVADVPESAGVGETGGHLIQTIDPGGPDGSPRWPRVRWVRWPAPGGGLWDVGEVRAGNADMPAGVNSVEGSHGIRWEFRGR
ncbi:MAG: hypothetical protein AB7J34_11815 [Limisphaerales bacterium]